MAAANVDLGAAVADGRFRPDLFYRLNVVNLHLPPLRERSGDIELLAQHFLRRFAVESGKPAFRWQPATLRKLLRHGWPGNVRELENVVLRAVALAAGPVIKPEDVGLPFPIIIPSAQSHAALKAKAILDFEKKYLDDLLRKHEGSISRAAVAAGQDPSNLRRLMRKCGLLPG
jgi:DNA-binding NtrC family response regulator